MEEIALSAPEIPGYVIKQKLYESRRILVCRATRLKTGESVILKILKPEAAANKDEVTHFRYEYGTISRLNLPSVVKAIAIEEYRGSLVIVMEDIGGKPLDRFQFPLSLEQFFDISTALADALGLIHKKKIIHKRINPSNIIWNPAAKQLNIIDFGIADEIPERTVSSQTPSTIEEQLEYISPEQTGRMNRVVDYRTDFYSLGITYYQILTGKLPFVATDALGIIHLHIAGTPIAPHVLDPVIPEMISHIVMKLIAKMADDRYQSVHGMKVDLERCRRELGTQAGISDFELGSEDFSDRLRMPQRIYGRDMEMNRLLAAFDQACAGENKLLLVAGYAGVGKTRIVRELQRIVLDKQGHFIEGKFEQLQRAEPYWGWIRAFTMQVDYLLMENERIIDQWKRNILKAVGKIGKVLTDAIPNLELIIGSQPDIPELGGIEAQNRFNYIVAEFVKAIAGKEHPMIIFLDDIQWIDAASLKLFQVILTDSTITNLLIIGAYRDNEVDNLHPLAMEIEALRKGNANFELMKIRDLTEEMTNIFIADILNSSHEKTAALNHLIYLKTGGNPFFILQTLMTLVERRGITFNKEHCIWQWDNSVIGRMEITDNIVTLMIEKIRQLEPEVQHLLPIAACVGFQFKVSQLSIITKQSEEEILDNLRPTLREGLIIAVDGQYQFVHDRIQQAAYSLIPPEELPAQHLQIGRLLLDNTLENKLAEDIFEIVDHLNRGSVLISNPSERTRLAELNLIAGRRAKAAAAFTLAENYFDSGTKLLSSDAWETRYNLKSDLIIEQAESQYFIGKFTHSEALLHEALDHACSLLIRAWVYRHFQRLYRFSGRWTESVGAALKGLELFGVTFPERDEDIHVAAKTEALQVEANLRGRSIASLADVRFTDDPEIRLLIGLLAEAEPQFYITRPVLWPLTVARCVNLCLVRGHVEEAPYIYCTYAMVLVAHYKDIPSAFQYSQMSLKLNERLPPGSAMKGRPLFFHASVVNIWCNHFRTSLPLLDQAFRSLVDSGDFIWASLLTYHAIWLHFVNGDPLERYIEFAQRYVDFNQHNHSIVYYVNRLEAQLAISLQGKTRSLTDFNSDFFDEAACVAALEKAGFGTGIAYYRNIKLIAAYTAGHFEEASEWAEKIKPLLPNIASMAVEGSYYFYKALTLAALYEQTSPTQRHELIEEIRCIQQKQELWANYSPENFYCRVYLVGAEIARIEKRDQDAMRFYEQAIFSARENGFIHIEGEAYEAAAEFYRQRGFEKFATTYLIEAVDCYSRWGALGKVRQLNLKYLEISQVRLRQAATLVERLDTATLTKAQQAISSEIELDRLLAKVIHLVMENAGAQNGSLLMEKDGGWTVIAKGDTGHEDVDIPSPVTIDLGNSVSPGVVRFVARTKTKIVLDNAALQGEFVNDPYIRARSTRSLLCAPLLHRGKLISILYLENNLTTHAFTPERVLFLEMLLSQVAISLEIAEVYEALKRSRDHLEELVKERTAQLQVAKEQAESANNAKSTFLSHMSHELRTPLNSILGFARLIKETPDVTSEQRKYLDIITLSGGHLLNLINNVLDMSKIESGRMTLEVAPIDLYKLIQEMRSIWYVNAKERGLSFIVEQSPELPQRIDIDAGKLRQILINLIGNAIKYTRQGGVTLRAMVAGRESAEQVRIRFEVADTGPGISEEEKIRIFRPFARLKEHASIETGTGLGLAISRQYVDLMGGVIDIVSEKGKGSVFFFELPARELPSEVTGIALERSRAIGLEKGQPRYRLLIAEDQLENRILLHKILEPFGFDIREVSNGKEAVVIFGKWHPDLIWMDIRMPVMDGLEATRRIRSTDADSPTKIIAITAQALEEDRMRIMQAGCDDFIRKPYRHKEIFDALTKHLGLRFIYEEKPVPLEEPEIELKPEQLAIVPADLLRKLHRAVIELNPELIQEITEQIMHYDPVIGRSLQNSVNKFDYDHLLRLLDEYSMKKGETDD